MQSNPFTAIQQAFQARAAQLACAAINHLLLLEPTIQAQLKAHPERSIRVCWQAMLFAPAGEQWFSIKPDLSLCAMSASDQPADVTVSLLAGLIQATSDERLRFIRIEGDALLAQDLATVAKQLRWDAEHDLAQVIGGTPARWLSQHAENAIALFQQAVSQLKASTRSAVLHYPGWVVEASDFENHSAELGKLKKRVDALAARMAGVKR